MKVLLLAILTVQTLSFSVVVPSFGMTKGKGSVEHVRRPSFTSTSTSASASATATTSDEIIPREVLFGNPKYASPQISPDGIYISFLAPSDEGVLNVFVRKLADIREAIDTPIMVTNDESRGIRQYNWAPDSKTILYMQDFEGDENFHLWAVDATKESNEEKLKAVDLTPGENVKASNLIMNKRYKDTILVATNERDPTCFDMYRVNYKTGEKVMDTKNPGDVLGWGTEDESFEIREAVVMNQSDSSTTIRVRNSAKDEWRDLITFPYGEEGELIEFTKDGKGCYMTSTIGRDTKALLHVDVETGETLQVLSFNDKCDLGGIDIDDDTKEIRAVSYNYARNERTFYNAELQNDYEVLKIVGGPESEVNIVSKTEDEKIWIAACSTSDGPTEYVVYYQDIKMMMALYVSVPELRNYKLAKMEDIRVKTRDGLELVGYLTRADTEKKTPLVLLVHGGPWARDYWGFNPTAQWFANRGYATLQMNYRASTGYGKSFLHKGDGEWGVGAMQNDLTDSVQWAIDEGIADPEKICIYGGSYGGYATLAGLTFTPDLYSCGVDIVGPSNIKTLLDSIPPYWGPLRNDMLKKIGNVDDDEEFNKKISPLFHVDEIKKPLLIGQGANDPRVKQAEADQIAFSMKEKGIPVEYVLYPDEGHGFARPDNKIDFNGRAEQFLAEHLGGRSEPFVEPEGATAQFPLEETTKVVKEN